MAVDVSGLVNMLATQPGQQMANLGQSLMAAKEYSDKQRQQQFENTRIQAKDALEKQLADKKIALADLQIMSEKADLVNPVFTGLMMAESPLARQQIFQQSLPTFEQVGTPPEIVENIKANLMDNDFLGGMVARSLSAKDVFALTRGTSVDPTTAAKKKAELIEAGVSPEQAEGIAYGTYKVITDDTGNQRVFDLRSGGRLSPEQEAVVLNNVSPQQLEKKYEPKVIVKGTKLERERAKAVNQLSKEMINTNAPEMESVLETAESIIDATYAQGKDLPGFGPIESMSVYPDMWVSPEGQDLRQAVVKLFNMTLADRSGAAVTNPEFERLKDEFKSGAWKTERQFVTGIEAFRKVLEDHKKATLAGFSDDVKQQYWDQGGITLREQKEAPKDVSTTSPTEEQIRADAEKYGWSEEETENAIKTYVRQ